MKYITKVDDRLVHLELDVRCADAQEVRDVLKAFEDFLKIVKTEEPQPTFSKYGRPYYQE